MRLWPFRRRRAISPLDSHDLLLGEEQLRRPCRGGHGRASERQIRGGVILFRGELTDGAGPGTRTCCSRASAPFGYTPFSASDNGHGVVLQAWPLGEIVERPRRGPQPGPVHPDLRSRRWRRARCWRGGAFDLTSPTAWLRAAVPFAVTLLSILGVHEFGHYFTARYYKAAVSLPYFIPAPPPIFLFGTLGAIIRMRSPARDRNSLFDIAAAGPLAGLMVAIPAILLGLSVVGGGHGAARRVPALR